MAQKQELWQQLGYDSFRDWRLADAKQRRATARKESRLPFPNVYVQGPSERGCGDRQMSFQTHLRDAASES